MSNLTGTLIIAPIVPPTTQDQYGTHYAKYGIGGHRTVSSLLDRDNIPVERRENLMLVSVESTGKTYQLTGSVWNEFASENLSGIAYVEKRYVNVTGSMGSLTVVDSFASGYIDLFVNGIKLIRDFDYTDYSPPTVIFNNPIPSGSVLEYLTYTRQTSYVNDVGSINFSHITETMVNPVYTIDFAGANIQVVQPVGAEVTIQFTNIHFGKIVYLKLKKHTRDYTLNIPAACNLYSGLPTMAIFSNTCVGISFSCCGDDISDIDVATAISV